MFKIASHHTRNIFDNERFRLNYSESPSELQVQCVNFPVSFSNPTLAKTLTRVATD
ncbi:hypothetical protein KPSB59_3300034 [Klebsiella quasipneumoniae subsp. quasipneumoniae]|nr:hypothetical protein KPSB59_3300034 [Klebsiella quasipneumoniae subsp. quasipneumoniae]